MKIYRLPKLIFVMIILGLEAETLRAEQCSSVFTNPVSTSSKEKVDYFPSPVLKAYYKKVGSWDTAVPFHILNTDALFTQLKRHGIVSGMRAPFEKGIDGGLEQIILKEFSSSFIIVKSEKDQKGVQFTLKDVMGRWFTVRGKKALLSKTYKLDFSTLEFVPSERNDLNEYSNYLQKIYVDTRIDRMGVYQLADHLSRLQVKTSTNVQNSSNKVRDQFMDGLNEGNLMLAELFKSNAPMTEDHLSKLNLFANKGINPYEFEANAPMAGVLRGASGVRVVVDGKSTVVDMSLFEVAQTWELKITTTVQRLNYFLPAKDVPNKVKDLLVRINRLDRSSLPMEVFKIYKEFIHTHPFADGNGRTGRMLLNYLLLKAGLPPAIKPAASLFYRAEDSLRKYVEDIERDSGQKAYRNHEKQVYDFKGIKSFKNIYNISAFAEAIKNEYHLESIKLEHLHGTSSYLFVAVYKGRYIQFESTHKGDLSDSLHTMLTKGIDLIERQEREALSNGKDLPKFAIYPELLEQFENYHRLYQEHEMVETFLRSKSRPPNAQEMVAIRLKAQNYSNDLLKQAQSAQSDYEYISTMMHTPRSFDRVQTAEEVADRIMSITAPPYKKKVYEGVTTKLSVESRKALVEIYNAFNSERFDQFMTEIVLKALKLCRQNFACSSSQRSQIPEKFLALVLKNEADQRGILLETISRQAGREPGRLFIQRVRRGSLIIDDGAPGNHGLMPHALQNLFIYEQLGLEKAKKFFGELTGWTYERLFDSNEDFTPIQATRDITRRHYWTGIILSGNRSDSSKLGSLVAEEGRYPDFLRKNQLELVEVKEKEKNLVNDGAIVIVRFGQKIFEFEIDRDGVPLPGSQGVIDRIKAEVYK